jgi:hypothetical protein
MGGNLRVLVSEEGADAERVCELAGYLRAELLQLDVANVSAVQGAGPPPGARGGSDVAAAGGLLVAFGQAAEGLRSVIAAIQDWLSRGRDPGRVVRLELAGDVLELSHASEADQERLIELFVSRHAVGGGGR